MARPTGPAMCRDDPKPRKRRAALHGRADGAHIPGDDLSGEVATATHVLITAGPSDGRDPVLAELRDSFAAAENLQWVGYLSTTGVYGDHGGGWVDEDTPLTPSTARGRARVAAEAEWQALHREHGLPLHVSFVWPGSTGRGGDRSPRCGPEPRGASSSRGRCSVAATWRISRRSSSPPSAGRIRGGLQHLRR
jgi:hypothetical protein